MLYQSDFVLDVTPQYVKLFLRIRQSPRAWSLVFRHAIVFAHSFVGGGSVVPSLIGIPVANVQLGVPSGVALDGTGDLYFSGFANNLVLKLIATTG
jgi:hypothetical protein